MSDAPMDIPATEQPPAEDNIFQRFWPWIRETFPPARAVAFLVPLVTPIIAIFSGWLIDHLPFIADQVNGGQITAFVLATMVGIIALAYKWLDGRAKWEGSQIDAHVLLAQANKITTEEAEKVLEPPPEPRRRRRQQR